MQANIYDEIHIDKMNFTVTNIYPDLAPDKKAETKSQLFEIFKKYADA